MSRVHINELFAQTASKAKKMRYFFSLYSENLRLAPHLPNEVFLTISVFKVDIPYKHTLRITLIITEAAEGNLNSTLAIPCPTTATKILSIKILLP